MALNPSPPKNLVLVAIDVAKRRNEVLIAFPGAVRRKRLSVLNARAEHDRFISYLIGLDAPVVAARDSDDMMSASVKTSGDARRGAFGRSDGPRGNDASSIGV